MTDTVKLLSDEEIDEVVEWLRGIDMDPLFWGGFLSICAQAKTATRPTPNAAPDRDAVREALVRSSYATLCLLVCLHFQDVREDMERRGLKNTILENDLADGNLTVAEVIERGWKALAPSPGKVGGE